MGRSHPALPRMSVRVIGDPAHVAVAFEVLEPRHPMLWGRFCYQAGGRRLGDFDLAVPLGGIRHSLKWAVWDNGKRDAEPLRGHGAKILFWSVNAQIYEQPPVGVPVVTLEESMSAAAFDITLGLSGWKVFLFDFADHSRLVHHDYGRGETGQLRLDLGSCDRVLATFHEELLALVDAAESDPLH